MANIFKDKSILVTGGTGSIGSEIVRKVLRCEPRVVRVLSNDEDGLFNLEHELRGGPRVRFLIGDVKDKQRLRRAIEGINFVFHAAALKHVPLCEYNPFEAVQTNVLGTQNIIEAAIEEEVDKLITLSTDKAVNPINVMGATKLLAERLTVSADYPKGAKKTVFSCVRFGNVLDSRGSVLPLFREQIQKGGPVTITDPDMTRFVMSIPSAIDLVMEAVKMAEGGEIFIFKMPVFRLSDLAEVAIEELAPRYGYAPQDIEVKIIGRRLGEKSYEELLTEDEAMYAYETEDMFIISQRVENRESRMAAKARYTSRDTTPLTREELRNMLRKNSPLCDPPKVN